MRPVRLHIEGFGVYRAPVDLDFDDVDYFAMVGPTGAGKSTIIDAICFALYGSIPRYGDERLVGRAVSVGGHEAKVSLTFDVAGQRYHATRVVRLGKGKPDAILERDIPGGTEILASRPSEMFDASLFSSFPTVSGVPVYGTSVVPSADATTSEGMMNVSS